jgi:hypothetical protein
MSACEYCWSIARHRALRCGGTVTRHYTEVLAEQERMRSLADCPEARRQYGECMAPDEGGEA